MHNVIKAAEVRMQKTIEAFKQAMQKLRTGRANPSLLEHIRVEYYGNEVPLNQVANITIGDARTLNVTPFEKRMVSIIEKAIMTSDLGLNPATSGEIIRVPLPVITEERRKEFTKLVRNEAETARVSIRNVRRDANAELKELLKNKQIAEDEERRLGEAVQKLTDKFTVEVDNLLAVKEKDLMAI
ncbi:MAG TPA: ribosome recycling factor [Gammaproteobacteria bacterium]|jgi:ribosome recycling factor|nr:ribosome recycling factor [Gammaproteobacteria bacterium]